MKNTKYIMVSALVGTMVLGSAGTAFAAQDVQDGKGKARGQEKRLELRENGEQGREGEGRRENGRMGIVGDITAISGTALTMTVVGPKGTTKTVTIDASKATFEKITFESTVATGTKPTPTTQTLADLAVGEKIDVKGGRDFVDDVATITAVTVTELSGDVPARPPKKDDRRPENASSTKKILPEGRRGIVGEVTIVDGSTLTLKAGNDTVYTVDATDAEIKSGTTTVTLGSIAVGNRIAVRGEVDGTTIDAAIILTNIPEAPANARASDNGKERSLRGKIGSFFGKLFGKKVE